MVSHRFDGARRRAGRSRYTDVVERDHAPLRGELVDEGGIPVVEVAAEVLQQNEWYIAVTEVAVGVLDPVFGRDAPGRGVDVADGRFDPRLVVRGCHRTLPSRMRVACGGGSIDSAA